MQNPALALKKVQHCSQVREKSPMKSVELVAALASSMYNAQHAYEAYTTLVTI